MIGLEVFLVLLITRLLLPVGFLILLGEWMRGRERCYWLG